MTSETVAFWPTSRRRAAVRVSQLIAGGLTVAYLLSTVFRAHHESSTLWDGWVGNLGYGACTVLCLWRAITVRVQRRAWTAIGISLALFTAGAVLWTTTVQYWDPVPYPSISDLFFLIFYPVAFLGVGLLVRSSVAKGTSGIWIDGVIAALGVAALEASIVIAPISHSNHGNAATVATNLAYPIGDMVLMIMIVVVFAISGWRPGRLWWTLGLGLGIFAAADSVYVLRVTSGTYVTGTVLDSLWLVGAFFIATAAWQESGAHQVQGQREQPVLVPGLLLLSSLGIVLYAAWKNVLPLGVGLATSTILVATARMAFAYRQLRTLAETRREARTDELTGLANRRMFYESLRRCLEREGEDRLAVLMIDLDRFKEINDSLGHHVGDDVLRQLGPRLAAAVGDSGIVARLGGDEFGLLLAPVTEAWAVTELADAVCNVLREPLQLESMTLRVDASIGIAIAPEHGVAADTLLQKADVAMYEAKRTGRAWELYSAARDIHTKERLELMEDLRDAIDRMELILFYQPKVDARTGSVIGVEALVRWEHPTRGLLSPDEFLPLVEQSGLIGPLAHTVLDQALNQQARWERAGLHLVVAVNLSAANLADDGLPEHVAALLARRGVQASSLILEITEDCLMTDPERSRRILQRLRDLGVGLSVDDYGTGFSSLSYLRVLPVSEVKLDRMFLAGVPEDERAVAIIRSTVDLAHALGLEVVVEGIETAEVLEVMRSLGCDVVQGYFLGRPARAADLFDTEASARFGVAERRASLTVNP